MFTGQFFSSCAPHVLIIEFLKLCSLSLQLHRGVSSFQLAAAMKGHPSIMEDSRENFSPLSLITEGELNPPQKFSHRLRGLLNTHTVRW